MSSSCVLSCPSPVQTTQAALGKIASMGHNVHKISSAENRFINDVGCISRRLLSLTSPGNALACAILASIAAVASTLGCTRAAARVSFFFSWLLFFHHIADPARADALQLCWMEKADTFSNKMFVINENEHEKAQTNSSRDAPVLNACRAGSFVLF